MLEHISVIEQVNWDDVFRLVLCSFFARSLPVSDRLTVNRLTSEVTIMTRKVELYTQFDESGIQTSGIATSMISNE